MNIDLMNGTFSPNEAMELISRLVDAKIRFLQDRIETTASEEDIKMRETRIRRIQSEFHQAKKTLMGSDKPCEVVSTIALLPR